MMAEGAAKLGPILDSVSGSLTCAPAAQNWDIEQSIMNKMIFSDSGFCSADP
jgi:hypothetical protein